VCGSLPKGADLATRLDKWLWAARFYKTRTLANAAVLGGRVHVNGARAKPARDLRIGDTVEVSVGSVRRVVTVTGVSEKRGPASTVADLYAETPESIRTREQAALERRAARPPGADLGTRPTKLDRRRLDALRRAGRRAR
jgi:ribosome-associated heat shock protein Hsp15